MTSPERPRPAPNDISAIPAASASFTTTTGRPTASEKAEAASAPIHDESMLAALCTTPARTTAGKATPTGPLPPVMSVK